MSGFYCFGGKHICACENQHPSYVSHGLPPKSIRHISELLQVNISVLIGNDPSCEISSLFIFAVVQDIAYPTDAMTTLVANLNKF